MHWTALITGRSVINLMMLLYHVDLSSGQTCIDTDNVNILESGTGMLATGAISIITSLDFTCNGIITSIRARVRCTGGNNANNFPFIQVWRPSSDGSTVYNRVGEVELQVTSGNNGNQVVNIILMENDTMRFQSGDVVGYYDPGARCQVRTATTAGYLLHHNQFSQSPDTIDLNNFDAITDEQPLIQFTTAPFVPESITASIPGVPRNSTTLLVTWERPLFDQAILSGYELCYVESSIGDCDNNGMKVNITGADQLSYTINDLSINTNYTIEVRGRTGVGLGDPATTNGTTDEDAPDPVMNIVAQFSPNNTTRGIYNITWTPPGPTNGSFYQRLEYSYSSTYNVGPTYNGSFSTDLDQSQNQFIFDALYYSNYTFTITTINIKYNITNGPTHSSTHSSTQSSPAVPIALRNVEVVMTTTESIFISWDHPEYPNSQLLNYIIYYIITPEVQQSSIPTEDFENRTVGTVTGYNLTELKSFTSYTIRITVSGRDVGNAPYMEIVQKTNANASLVLENITASIPGVPRNSTTLLVTWERPFIDQAILSGYELCYVESSVGDCDNNGMKVNITGVDQLSYIINDLSINTNYIVEVRGRTGAGLGDPATANGTTDEDAPDLVMNIVAQFSPINTTRGIYNITWTPPRPTNGSFYQRLEYSYSSTYNVGPTYNGSFSTDLDQSQNQFIFDALYYSNYTFTITTINIKYNITNGPTRSSTQSSPAVPITLRNVEVVMTTTESIFIRWDHPEYPNSQLLNYIIYYIITPEVQQSVIPTEDFENRTIGIVTGYNLTELKSFTSYTIRITVSGRDVGNAPYVEIVQRTNAIGGCPFKPDEVRNITWPATNTSTTARQKCPGNGEAERIATRQCNQNGEWEAPDVSQCRTVELRRIETRAEELITVVTNNDDGDNFMPEDVVDITDQLNKVLTLQLSTPLLPNDIISAANTLNIIILITNMTINEMDQSLTLSVIEDAIDILNNLLDPRNDESFQDISTQSLEQGVSGESVSEQLLMNTEQLGILLVSTLNTTNNESVRTIGNPNIAIEVQILMQEDLIGITSIQFPTLTNTSTDISLVFGSMTPMIEIPSTIILRQFEEGNEVPIINIISRNPHLPTNKGQRVESLILSSQISTDLQRRVFLDGETVQLTFNIGVPENNATRFNPRCAFFRFSSNNNENGEFLTDGITQSNITNNTFVQCTSTHLTSFAVLVDKSGESDDTKPLAIVSYIGCAISIVCLLFTIGVLIILRKKAFNQVQHFLHLNLCIALLLGLVTFVSGIETAAEYRESCLAVAVLLHYIFMAAFCWMLCEGMLLFITLNFLFYTGFLKSRKFFFAIGWGLPVPIVAVSAALSHEYYGINDRCWISEENGAIWAFIGPMLLIILVNVFFLIVTSFRVYKNKHQKETAKEITTIESVKASLKAAIIVIPILGCTWIVGILAINENTVVFAWIFTILNSLQGAFIMFFYVLRNDMFIEMIKHRVKDYKTTSTMERFISKNGPAVKQEDDNCKAALTQCNKVISNDYVDYKSMCIAMEQQESVTSISSFTPSQSAYPPNEEDKL